MTTYPTETARLRAIVATLLEYRDALQAYDSAYRIWTATSVHDPEEPARCKAKDAAKAAYEVAERKFLEVPANERKGYERN